MYMNGQAAPRSLERSADGAGALDFRDFSGSLAAKENRTGSHQTLLFHSATWIEIRKDNMSIGEVTHNRGTISNKEVEEVLKSVIQNLIDGQEGFQKVAESLKDATHKHYFLEESLKRASFRGDLETALHQEGVHDVKESGTVSGTIQRTWGELKVKLGGGDHALLETAEQGEDATKKAYKKALEKELPLPIHQMLSTQYAHIEESHDYVKAARDARK
jgi:uncharacterized protein (TIGR02284 family)